MTCASGRGPGAGRARIRLAPFALTTRAAGTAWPPGVTSRGLVRVTLRYHAAGAARQRVMVAAGGRRRLPTGPPDHLPAPAPKALDVSDSNFGPPPRHKDDDSGPARR